MREIVSDDDVNLLKFFKLPFLEETINKAGKISDGTGQEKVMAIAFTFFCICLSHQKSTFRDTIKFLPGALMPDE